MQASSARPSGRLARRLVLLVDEGRRVAAHVDRHRSGDVAHGAHDVEVARRHRITRRQHVDLDRVRAQPPRGRHRRRRPRRLAGAGRRRATAASCAGPARGDDADRRLAGGREVALDGLGDLARLRATRAASWRRWARRSTRRKGSPATISSAAVTTATAPGRRMTPCASRYQPPALAGRAEASAARRQRRGASAFTRGPSTASTAGSTSSATTAPARLTSIPPMPIERRKPSGKTSSEAIAAATVRALNSTVRPAVCSVRAIASRPGPVRGELLAVARHHEQAVVDGQAEAHRRDQVQREDRQLGHVAVDEPHGQEGRDDGQRAHERRHERGDDAAEDPQRQQEEDREGDQLGAREVLGDLRADLREGDVRRRRRSRPGRRRPRAAAATAASSSAPGSSCTRTVVVAPSRATSPGSRVAG